MSRRRTRAQLAGLAGGAEHDAERHAHDVSASPAPPAKLAAGLTAPEAQAAKLEEHLTHIRNEATVRIQSYARGYYIRQLIPGGSLLKLPVRAPSTAPWPLHGERGQPCHARLRCDL